MTELTTAILRPIGRVWLRTAVLMVAISVLTGCDLENIMYDRNDYVPTADDVNSRLSIRTENAASSMYADGFSRVTLLADVRFADRRAVLFTTSGGQFLGGRAEGGGVVVEAAGDGLAKVELQSPTSPQTIRVRAALKDDPRIAVELPLEILPVVPDSILRITEAPALIEADGAAVSQISVRVAPGLQQDRRKVQFRSNLGAFTGTNGATEEVQADMGGRATVFLRSPRQTGVARVLVTVAGVTQEAHVQVGPAYPQSITLDAGGFTIQASPKLERTITARLRRSLGTVTAGTEVRFTALTPQGDTIGSFRNVTTSNDAGEATAVYTTGTTSYRGPLDIVARVPGTSTRAVARIEVTDPPES